MDYYFLKIGSGNVEAKSNLEQNQVVIYFDDKKQKDYKIACKVQRKTGIKKQALDYYKCGQDKTAYNKIIIIVINDGRLWLLRPKGAVRFTKSVPKWSKKYKKDVQLRPKIMPVEKIINDLSCSKIPYTLAAIGANQYLITGTFGRIQEKYRGNIKAIHYVLQKFAETKKNKYEKEYENLWKPKGKTFSAADLLECLSAVELETLIAKLLESKGCFVPAHRGGTLKDIDLFAHNRSETDISFGDFSVPKKSTKTIQIKTRSDDKKETFGIADYLIRVDKGADGNEKTFGAAWLLEQVKNCTRTSEWLRNSLDWVPENFLEEFKLTPPAPRQEHPTTSSVS